MSLLNSCSVWIVVTNELMTNWMGTKYFDKEFPVVRVCGGATLQRVSGDAATLRT